MTSQQQIWDEEHRHPKVLLQMDSDEVSSGVRMFFEWLLAKNLKDLSGIEMGCGKGRNAIWLAAQGIQITGFDFSPTAIAVAQERARKADLSEKIQFLVQDATRPWPLPDQSFDIGIDCFASTDIESLEGRKKARDEFKRVLKPGGFLLVYTLSTDDEFHREMIRTSPASEPNSFYHPETGKFEKVFDREELLDFYQDFELIEERRIAKKAMFSRREYECQHFWMVWQK